MLLVESGPVVWEQPGLRHQCAGFRSEGPGQTTPDRGLVGQPARTGHATEPLIGAAGQEAVKLLAGAGEEEVPVIQWVVGAAGPRTTQDRSGRRAEAGWCVVEDHRYKCSGDSAFCFPAGWFPWVGESEKMLSRVSWSERSSHRKTGPVFLSTDRPR